ncbi:pilus assembly protein [Erwinia sp. P6884]|uniref:EcpB family pilus assembly chaperone n=1 Tax=Erwinia sp. P6884 TaxID=3141450 RepID=UPI00319240B2
MPAKGFFMALVFILMPLAAQAINVGTITTIIPAEKQLIAKEIKNESEMARLITVRVDRIDSPLSSGKIIPYDSAEELLSSPSQLMMPGNSKNIIKFWYQGKQDTQERYYRLTFTDEPISDEGDQDSGKYAMAQAKAVISTILVVQPREKNLQYALTPQGVVNKGNVSFRITAIGDCQDKKKKDCRELFYVMPGKTHAFQQVDLHAKGSHVGLWDIEHFIPLQ